MAFIDHGKTIHDTDTGRWIPKDARNRDYRKLVASGRRIDPAPPEPQPGPNLDPDQKLVQALRASATLDEVRAALIARFGG